MKRVIQYLMIAMTTMFVTACEPTEWEAEASCEGGSSSWNCKAGGKVKGTFEKQQSLSSTSWNAADFSLDLDGSTVGAPATGSVTISLVDSQTNVVQAAKAFGWIRSGARLYLVNPSDVNAWAQRNGAGADTIGYQLQPFAVSGVSPGDNMFSVTAEYAGDPKAVAITTFSGGSGCGIGYCQEQ